MHEPRGFNALLVYPRFPPSYWGFRYAIELMGKRSAMPPLGLITVAAMFPAHYRLRLVDTNVAELTDGDLDWADLVLTSSMVVQRRSLQEVIARCHRHGKPVVVGGPHPTSQSGRAGGHPHRRLGPRRDRVRPRLRDALAPSRDRGCGSVQRWPRAPSGRSGHPSTLNTTRVILIGFASGQSRSLTQEP